MTLQRLWEEYRENNPEGYQYSQFCVRYRAWVKTLDIALRQDYKAGEKLFVDYAGDTIPIHDPTTGETISCLSLCRDPLGRATTAMWRRSSPEDLPSWIGPTFIPLSSWGRCPTS